MKQQLNLCFLFFLLFSTSLVAQQPSITAPELPEKDIATTEMTFEEPEFNYGQIEQGEKITNVFKFTNTGDEPLIITSAKGSCGCTVPAWPKEPILPGETAQLTVQFNSKGKKGKQSKRVTLTANTEPVHTFLTIKGEVYTEDFTPRTGEAPEPVEIVNPKANVKLDIDINSIVVYPNPANELLKVNLSEFSGELALIEIYNLMGQRLNSKVIDEISNETIDFDISQYAAGAYTVSVKIGASNRIVKQFLVAGR